MIHVARYTLIAFGIFVGIPYVLGMIGAAKFADWYCKRARDCKLCLSFMAAPRVWALVFIVLAIVYRMHPF